MSDTDRIRKEIDLAPLSEEEIEIISQRRLDNRYENIVEKINNITPVKYEEKIYDHGTYKYTKRNNYIKHILQNLPINVLEALEEVLK